MYQLSFLLFILAKKYKHLFIITNQFFHYKNWLDMNLIDVF